MQFPHQFPSLKDYVTRVEQARLPVKHRGKTHSENAQRISNLASSIPNTLFPLNISCKSSLGKKSPSNLEVPTANILQWQLQIVYGPGHDHNNIESQRPTTRFNAFESIAEQIWRPWSSILDENVQCPNTETSLEWADFLRFWVLGETTPWEHWYQLYSKEHFECKLLMRDRYITHGWNKQSKTPIWLPTEVCNPGTLRSGLLKWFPTPKDKVTIVFNFINKDPIRTEQPVAEEFRNLSLKQSDHELAESISFDHHSLILVSSLFSSPQINSSPPLPCTYWKVSTEEVSSTPSVEHAPLASSSDSEFPSIKDLLALFNSVPLAVDSPPTLTFITSCSQKSDYSSSLLSTIPDSPQMSPPLTITSTTLNSNSTIPLQLVSKDCNPAFSSIFSSVILSREILILIKAESIPG